MADVLRTVATPKEWSKQLPFVEFAINDSVHASTGETPFYINGLRHPRSPVSFVRSPSLSEGGPLTSLEASSETQNEVSVLQDNDSSLLATATHDRPLGGVIGKLDAKSASEAKRFVDERLAITRKVREAIASAQDNKNNMQTNMVARIINALVLGTKCYYLLVPFLKMQFPYYLVVYETIAALHWAIYSGRGGW